MASHPASSALDAARLTAAFSEPIAPVRVTPLYRLGLVLVALTMIVLPLIYVGLVIAFGYGVYWHATENLTLLTQRGGSGKARFFAYAAPLVVGCVLLLFMVKPLFARRARQAEPLSLHPTEEPTLWAFIDRLTSAVGAPMPKMINVDHQVNASASFRRGLASMLGSDLVLTIGLPLVTGMSLRQLTGVLAHEFGHFAQGSGMRLTYVIRSISYWFARVVYERDAWDMRLEAWAKETDIRIGVVLHVARFCVWVTRKILWALMMVGHVVSCFMLRRMEFDADRYEARVSGSDVFAGTAMRLIELNVANGQAMKALQQSWRSGRLADDLPALITLNVAKMRPFTERKLQQHVEQSKTGWMDTHPCDRERIASARREASAGIFVLQDPATILFADFDALSRRVTRAFYESQLDQELPERNLVPTATLAGEHEEHGAAMKMTARYFHLVSPATPPLWPAPDASLDAPDDARRAFLKLREARQRMEAGAGAAKIRADRYRQLDEAATRAAQAQSLIVAGFQLDPQPFGIDASTIEAAGTQLRRCRTDQQTLESEAASYAADVGERLFTALRLLHHPQAHDRIHDWSERLGRVPRLVAIWRSLRDLWPVILDVELDAASLGVLLGQLQGGEEQQALRRAIVQRADEVLAGLTRLRESCDDARHPLGGEGTDTIADGCIEMPPDDDDVGAILRLGAQAAERLRVLYLDTIGALVNIAATVEGAVGLPPLPPLPVQTDPPEAS